ERARFDKLVSSQELVTLITALGTGFGRSTGGKEEKDEYNADKLRYHRIIIMTDADVDGSHIRTLLLTFFYRQMPELIERGHVYIGQPPLYKLKQGKQELYLKDDAALNSYLIASAVDNAELAYSPDAPPLSGPGLEKLLIDYQAALDQTERLGAHHDTTLLRTFLDAPPPAAEAWQDQALLGAWMEALSLQINQSGSGRARYRFSIRAATPEHPAALVVRREQHGTETTQILPSNFFLGSEFRPIAEAARQINGLIQPGARVSRANKSQLLGDGIAQAQAWLMEEAKRGRTIQRFKGLGEMNPEQLWETTVNPETRRLLQVRIEDAIAADQIFSTLMGDVVEPRRQFIEENALAVSNLDI
ncbi:toprim domain-containing protein, partial [Dokdonella sp.]|uniref:toprim domain-containing protein n=1 Tax=Dokdonella sp. TaxID=2291710 RepID=UPI003BAE763D